MKKLLSLVLALTMVFALAACGTTPAETTAPPETTAPVETTAPAAALVVDACILKEADDKMLNTYSVLAVNPEAPFADADGNAVADVALNTAGAEALIQRYVEGSRCALILVTHSLQQARRIADQIWYFHRGTLLEAGSTGQVLDHPRHPETKAFLTFYGI